MQRKPVCCRTKVKPSKRRDPIEVSLYSHWASLIADCQKKTQKKLIIFCYGVPQGSAPGYLLLMACVVCANRCNLSFCVQKT